MPIDSAEPGSTNLPLLDAIEARILGALIEKEATTPEAYPLTSNAVVLACNQKNNREPVLELEQGAVGHALRELEHRGLIHAVHGSRAQRYGHRFAQVYSVTVRQQAVLSVMLLRGPQTMAELFNRCERLSAFADIDEVRQTLERLMQRSPTLVDKLVRGAGQREDRYMHLLCGPIDEATVAAVQREVPGRGAIALEARVQALESQLQSVQAELQALRLRLP